MFALFSIDCWYNKFMVRHFFSVLKFCNFGLPTGKCGEIIVIDKKIKNSLGFRKMNKLRDFSSYNSLKVSIIISFNR